MLIGLYHAAEFDQGEPERGQFPMSSEGSSGSGPSDQRSKLCLL